VVWDGVRNVASIVSLFTAQPKAPASVLFKTTGDQGEKKMVIITTRRVSEGFSKTLRKTQKHDPSLTQRVGMARKRGTSKRVSEGFTEILAERDSSIPH
jgi:hypothetical protein